MQDSSEMMFYSIDYSVSSENEVTFVLEIPPHGVASITFPLLN